MLLFSTTISGNEVTKLQISKDMGAHVGHNDKVNWYFRKFFFVLIGKYLLALQNIQNYLDHF